MRSMVRQVMMVAWILVQTVLPDGCASPEVVRLTREYAVCASAGRMPNAEAERCDTYYLCAINSDGTLTVTVAHCPLSTVFSPEKLQCVSASTYDCPVTALAKEAPIEPELVADETGSFQCPDTGRFPNPSSIDCNTYYLCMENTNGQLVPYLAACIPGAMFSPEQGLCVVSPPAVCPNAATPTPTPLPSTTTTTTLSTETTSMAATFKCPSVGRFPNEQSTNCRTYYLCTLNTDKQIGALLTSCPLSTVFSSEELKCVPPESYTCPFATTEPTVGSSTTEMATETSETTTSSPTSTTDSSTTAELSTVETTSETTTSAIEENTEAPTSTTDGSVDYSTPAEMFVCPSEGRFPDPNAHACESYLLCIKNSIGTLTAVPFFCPPTSIFSEAIRLCVSANTHSCWRDPVVSPPSVDTTTAAATLSPTTATILPSTVVPTLPTPEPFICPSSGRHVNPNSIYCKSYFLCLFDTSSQLYAIELSCPAATIFDQDELRCVSITEYTCKPPTTSPTTSTPTITSPMTTAITTFSTRQPFTGCVVSGKFPDPDSDDCRSYIYCIRLATGTFLQNNFRCPEGTTFDADSLECVPGDQCLR